MLHLDGSQGEGGGQILRTSLSLAALVGQPVRLENIRASRPKPGLRPQHLSVVQALARVTKAEVEGAALNSQELTFRPRRPQAGHYLIDVAAQTGSAGSISLIAQALLPPLLRAGGPSTLILRGGTHVPWSPPVHYLSAVFLPALAQMGAQVSLHLERWGWYPRGGGEARLTIAPVREFSGCQWLAPPAETAFQAVSAASGVAGHVSRRQAARLEERLGRRLPVQEVPAVSQEPGSFVFIWGPQAGFSALGAKGKPAQKVADEAITAYLNFRERRAALDAHLADQMALYLPQAKSPSAFSTEAITSHLLTNLGVIEQFTGPTFNVQGRLGDRGEIRCPGSRL